MPTMLEAYAIIFSSIITFITIILSLVCSVLVCLYIEMNAETNRINILQIDNSSNYLNNHNNNDNNANDIFYVIINNITYRYL
jgi:hypothetical protein